MSPHGPSGTIHHRVTPASLVSRTVGHFVARKIEQPGQFPRECSLPTTGGANHIDALETADFFEMHSPQKNAIARCRTTCASAAGDHPTARTNQGFHCSASARVTPERNSGPPRPVGCMRGLVGAVTTLPLLPGDLRTLLT